MTTKLELAEILIEAEKTGRMIQERSDGGCQWRDYEGGDFHLEGYSYRLAPKKTVKRSGWSLMNTEDCDFFDTKEKAERSYAITDETAVYCEWETEE